MSVDILFKIAVDKKASDIHFHAGMPPVLRIDGNLSPIKGKGKLEGKSIENLVFPILSEKQKEILITEKERHFQYSIKNLSC